MNRLMQDVFDDKDFHDDIEEEHWIWYVLLPVTFVFAVIFLLGIGG